MVGNNLIQINCDIEIDSHSNAQVLLNFFLLVINNPTQINCDIEIDSHSNAIMSLLSVLSLRRALSNNHGW
jgi:hypothetical protein